MHMVEQLKYLQEKSKQKIKIVFKKTDLKKYYYCIIIKWKLLNQLK